MRSSSAGRVLIALVGGAGVASPAWGAEPVAAADAPSVRLDWEAPPECIDGRELDRIVSGELGRPAFAAGPDAELTARGRIARTDNGRHRAEVVLATSGGASLGVRTLASDNRDCRSLDAALTVMLAIMLNVRRADVAALVHESPPPPPPPPAAWRPRAGAGAGVVLGLLPQPGLEASAGVGLMRGGRLEPGVEVAGAWAADAAAAEGRVQVQAGSLRASVSPVLAGGTRADVRLRFSAGAGPMRATASGFPEVYAQTRVFVETRLGLQLGVRLWGPLWLQVGGEVGLLPLRPAFAVRNPDGTTETLFEPQAVIAAAGVGLAFRSR